MSKEKDFKFIQIAINSFEDNDKRRYLLEKYCDITIKKYFQQNITWLILKRRILIVEDYLHYCDNFKVKLPSQNSLEGYLWLYYERKYYLKDFFESIFTIYQQNIQLKNIKRPIFKRPKRSHQILKERTINILQNPLDKHFSEKYIFDTLIGYFHWTSIPSNVFISIKNIKYEEILGYFFIIHNFKFYLPVGTIQILNTIK